MKTIIKVSSTEEFFKRGKTIAKLADLGKSIPRDRMISFENQEDMERLQATANPGSKGKRSPARTK